MSCNWLLITLSCIGSGSLQYVPSDPTARSWEGYPNNDIIQPFPYLRYIDLPTLKNALDVYENAPVDSYPPNPFDKFIPSEKNENEAYQNTPEPGTIQKFYDEYDSKLKSQKKRQLDEDNDNSIANTAWASNIIDPFAVVQEAKDIDQVKSDLAAYSNNSTDMMEKKNFSPWGGKRAYPIIVPDKTGIEYMWSWKRSAALREPSMPKRVRFSPWGGKRSGHMVYKPGSKSPKLAYNSPIIRRFNLGMQFIPDSDKHHFQVVALGTNFEDKPRREELPFKKFLENIPRYFKPGHTYTDVNLKKDGKRKVKFSTWGGKRSPPIIGPIWTPSRAELKESILNALLMLSKYHEKGINKSV